METTKITTYQEQVLKNLLDFSGPNEPISGVKLAQQLRLKSRVKGEEGADIRQIIHALRKKNYPICANSRGYFYARDASDLTKFMMQLRKRMDSIQEAVNGLQQSFHNVGDKKLEMLDGGLEVGKAYVTRAIRVGDTAVIQKFPLGKDGRPIIPDNVELI